MRRLFIVSMVTAAASLALVLPAPAYDPWAWLLWGRELAHGHLSTLEGPAFKPLPVLVTAVLSGADGAAPWLWVVLARSGSVLACGLAFRLGQRLGGGSRLAGGLALGGVALCDGFLPDAAKGMSEGLLLAVLLLAGEAWAARRPRAVGAAAVAAALLRVETWPFLLIAGAVAWRRRPQDRPLLVGVGLIVPLAWFGGELLGSGTLLRSADRARVPNPGQPALADLPVLASLRQAVGVPLWPVWIGVACLGWWAWRRHDDDARRALLPAGLGLAWLAVVAAMAQAGFSGEPRYALPGVALVTISAATALPFALGPTSSPPARRWVVAASGVALALAVVPSRTADLSELRRDQSYQWQLQAQLGEAVSAAGGRDAVLACGQPYVGRLRGPLMAYRLGVAKHVVEPDQPPRAPGVVFRSALTAQQRAAPDVPAGFHEVALLPTWQVFAACREEPGGPAGASQ